MGRIAIDGRMGAYRRGGIASYTERLARALAPELAERQHTFILGYGRRGLPILPVGSAVHQPRLWTPPHHRLERYTLPIEFLRARPALVHSPDYLPVRGPWRKVITVHDLDFLRHPDRLTRDAQRYYGLITMAVHRADAVIAVSRATRDDIVTLLAVNAESVTVIHEAADSLFQPPNEGHAQPAERSRETPPRYFLMVGTIEPRKNHGTLLDAYAAYRRGTPDPAGLVVAGTEGWAAATTVARLREEPGVVWLGGVAPTELLPLYHRAIALLMPSWDEGFGLPVVEAMASGTPVVVSTVPALTEVAGEAALIAAPDDARAWVAAMTVLDAESSRRAKMREKGYRQAARFSWAHAARETADLYDRILVTSSDMGQRRKRAS
ncbi:MAG: glycosyltransferase family 4 protein [Thermomicrobiales bacterium]